MIQKNAPCYPAVHSICIQIASKCLWIIQGCLREEERGDALEAFYLAAREILDKPQPEPEV